MVISRYRYYCGFLGIPGFAPQVYELSKDGAVPDTMESNQACVARPTRAWPPTRECLLYYPTKDLHRGLGLDSGNNKENYEDS